MKMAQEQKTAAGPYAISPSGDLWVLHDTRTGGIASYPTTKAKARAEARYMNEQYAKLMAEEARIVRDEIHEMHMTSFGGRAGASR